MLYCIENIVLLSLPIVYILFVLRGEKITIESIVGSKTLYIENCHVYYTLTLPFKLKTIKILF